MIGFRIGIVNSTLDFRALQLKVCPAIDDEYLAGFYLRWSGEGEVDLFIDGRSCIWEPGEFAEENRLNFGDVEVVRCLGGFRAAGERAGEAVGDDLSDARHTPIAFPVFHAYFRWVYPLWKG